MVSDHMLIQTRLIHTWAINQSMDQFVLYDYDFHMIGSGAKVGPRPPGKTSANHERRLSWGCVKTEGLSWGSRGHLAECVHAGPNVVIIVFRVDPLSLRLDADAICECGPVLALQSTKEGKWLKGGAKRRGTSDQCMIELRLEGCLGEVKER